MTYSFPTEWKLNICSRSDLSNAIDISVDALEKIECRIPRLYRYSVIERRGHRRTLRIPSRKMRTLQSLLLKRVLSFEFPPYVCGGLSGKSIMDHAERHVGKKWVACLDVHHFFPSVHLSRVRSIFEGLGCRGDGLTALLHLTTYQHELPQGAPSSPVIANLSLHEFDRRVAALCYQRQLTYTRYFDDIAISGNRRLEKACADIVAICGQSGFVINTLHSEKFRIMPSTHDQVVTGLIVNGPRLRPNEAFLILLRDKISRLAEGKIVDDESLDKLEATINGMIAFLKWVDARYAKKFITSLPPIKTDALGINLAL